MKKKLLSVVLSLAVAFTFSFAAVGTASAAVEKHTHLYKSDQDVVWSEDYTEATITGVCNDKSCAQTVTQKMDVKWTKLYHGENSKQFTGVYVVEATIPNEANPNWAQNRFDGDKQFVVNLTDAKINIGPCDAKDYLDFLEDWAKPYTSSKFVANPMTEELESVYLVDQNNPKTYETEYDEVKYTDILFGIFDDGEYAGKEFGVLQISPVDYEAYDEGYYDVTIGAKPHTRVVTDQHVFKAITADDLSYNLKWEEIKVVGTAASKGYISVTDPTFTFSLDGYTKSLLLNRTNINGTTSEKTNAVTYDGAAHNVVPNEKNVTAKYIVKKGKDFTAAEASSLKDADFDADTATVKDEGTYYIYVKPTLNTQRSTFFEYQKYVVVVDKAAANLKFKKTYKEVEEGTELSFSDLVYTDGFFEDVDAIVAKYYEVKGLKELVAGDTVTLELARNSVEMTAEDAAVLNNYNICCNDTMYLTVTEKAKAANAITAKAKSKVYNVGNAKATKAAHKLTLKASATYGTVKFTKKTGNSKIAVTSDGKVTVKKGLKKGEYKIVIKCTVDEGEDYQGAVDYTVLRIKVKK